MTRTPAQFRADLVRVHVVAAVMPGAVFHKLDQVPVRFVRRLRGDFIQNIADGFDDGQIGRLVLAADIVGGTYFTPFVRTR
jgi:hypothetical protein